MKNLIYTTLENDQEQCQQSENKEIAVNAFKDATLDFVNYDYYLVTTIFEDGCGDINK